MKIQIDTIPYGAFDGCTGLTAVEIPASVVTIGANAFKGCTDIREVRMSDMRFWYDINFGNALSNPLWYGDANLYLNSEFSGWSYFSFINATLIMIIPL